MLLRKVNIGIHLPGGHAARPLPVIVSFGSLAGVATRVPAAGR